VRAGEKEENCRKEFVMTESQPPPPTALVPPTPVPVTLAAGAQVPYSELEHAATYLMMIRKLRGIGIGNIIAGILIAFIALTVAMASTTPKELLTQRIAAGVSVVGLFAVAEGIWFIAAPSVIALTFAAISMFLFAALSLLSGRIYLPFALGFYGYSLLVMHKKYGHAFAVQPAPQILDQGKQLLDLLRKAKRKKSPDLIEFSTFAAYSRRLWRGLLSDRLLVLVAFEGRMIGQSIADLYFLPPAGMTIDVTRKEALGSWLKGTFIVNDQKFTGTIPPECFERFETWQRQYALPPAPPPVAAPVAPEI
jgi:hypothetical protein